MQMTVKVAVSLPKTQFQLAEKQRRLLRVSRSAMVREALQQWLKKLEEHEAVRRYVEGYQRQPQSRQDARAMQQASMEALAHETW